MKTTGPPHYSGRRASSRPVPKNPDICHKCQAKPKHLGNYCRLCQSILNHARYLRRKAERGNENQIEYGPRHPAFRRHDEG